MPTKVITIAEVGSNFNGDLDLARKYVASASQMGASAIKFQTLRKDLLISPWLYPQGIRTENPIYNQFSNLELPDDWHSILKQDADKLGIEFISTPFYLKAVDLLEKVGVKTYKIASGDITFYPLLEAVGSTRKKIILSTGASGLGEIEDAVNILQQRGAMDIVLLHCVSNYPPKWEEMNLKAIGTLKSAFGLPVGISDHSPGFLVPIAAAALGAEVVEKHVTFDRTMPGPDHPFAMTLDEFGEMVHLLSSLKDAMGTGRKVPTEAEKAKQQRIRRDAYDPDTFSPAKTGDGIWLRPKIKG